ncbi:MAG: hypothetical protein GXO09_05595 [Crenarchaeota archaeon]|nr:hypothetical protein [Thermoproteota archaeon]
MGWSARRSVRLRGFLNLILQLDILIERRDVGLWIASLLFYWGTVGTILTCLLAAFAGPVVLSSNTVPRPHALPILTPALEKFFISWPQLFYGMGVHGHMITSLYMMFPAYIALAILAIVKYPGASGFLFPRGDFKDVVDHIFYWAAVISAGVPSALAFWGASKAWITLVDQLHVFLGWFWIVISMVCMGMAFRMVLIALTSIWQLIVGERLPRFTRKIAEEDPWYRLVTKPLGEEEAAPVKAAAAAAH